MEVNGLVEKQNLRILPLALHLQNNWRSRIGDEDPDGRRLNEKQRIKQKFVSTKITKINSIDNRYISIRTGVRQFV